MEDNCITEKVDNIFDNEGRKYYLKINHFYDNKYKAEAIYIHIIRCKRIVEVGRAYCIFESLEDMLLADIIISHEVKFESLIDKLFKLRHRNEPTNYQKKQLGSYLLSYIIDLAKTKGIKKIYGSLTHQDIDANPNLINWYQKRGFKLEPPTSKEVETAKYRICLYLD